MLQNIQNRRGGFTLVEIMIVVAIIALLATFAVPNFLRARQRTQAGSIKQEALMLEQARDQWQIENNKKSSDAVTWADLKPYIKSTTQLYAKDGKDMYDNAYILSGTAITVNDATRAEFTTDVTGTNAHDFWKPYDGQAY